MMARHPGAAPAVLLLAAALACCASPGQTADARPKPQGKPMSESTSSAEQVRAHFTLPQPPPPWTQVKTPGADLFWVALPSRGPDDDRGRGAAVIGGQVLVGAEALRAVLALAGTPRDAASLASLASLLLGRDGEPVRDPGQKVGPSAGAPQIVAQVRPPLLDGDVLTFWTVDGRIGRPALARHVLSLSTLAFTTQEAARLLAATEDPVERARRALASGSLFAERDAVAELALRVGDDKAAAALEEAVAGHKRAETRGLAAAALGKVHRAGSTAVLLRALTDGEAGVRWRAADALGQIGDRSARPALERLRDSDPDASARSAATRALARL